MHLRAYIHTKAQEVLDTTITGNICITGYFLHIASRLAYGGHFAVSLICYTFVQTIYSVKHGYAYQKVHASLPLDFPNVAVICEHCPASV